MAAKTAIQAMEVAWAKRGIEFSREHSRSGWTKLRAPSADMVLVFKPDGTLAEQRTIRQDDAKLKQLEAKAS